MELDRGIHSSFNISCYFNNISNSYLEVITMTLEKAIEIVKENCYVFNPLNFDRTTLINSALDMIINAAKEKEVR